MTQKQVQDLIQNLIDSAQSVVDSSDDAGCTEDLTVCSKVSVDKLEASLKQIRDAKIKA